MASYAIPQRGFKTISVVSCGNSISVGGFMYTFRSREALLWMYDRVMSRPNKLTIGSETANAIIIRCDDLRIIVDLVTVYVA